MKGRTAKRLLRTSTRSSSSMYSQMRLYSVCMMSGALQKNSGVSSTVLSRFTAARWMNTCRTEGMRFQHLCAGCHTRSVSAAALIACSLLRSMAHDRSAVERTFPISWAIAFRDMLTFPASR